MTAPTAETFAALERELAACKDALSHQTATSNESQARLEAVSDGTAPILMHGREAGPTPGTVSLAPAGLSGRYFLVENALSSTIALWSREIPG